MAQSEFQPALQLLGVLIRRRIHEILRKIVELKYLFRDNEREISEILFRLLDVQLCNLLRVLFTDFHGTII